MGVVQLEDLSQSRSTSQTDVVSQDSSQLRRTPRDEAHLARFGKKQQLKRNFRFLSILAMTCTIMVTWEGFLTTFEIGLLNGGPSGVLYGYIFVWIGATLQALVMAEMGSMVPVAGGQYNWVSVLAPASCSKFLSYLTGWSNFITWHAGLSGAAFQAGTMIQSILDQNYPEYNPQRWQGTLLLYAVILLALFINTWLVRLLPQIECLVMVVHVLGFFGVLIPLVYLSYHSPPSNVFQDLINGGGWPTDGLSFLIGLSGTMYAFVGTDTSAHMAEEVEDASRTVPWSMIYSVVINGSLGFAIMISLLFCLGDIDAVLSSKSNYPFIQVFYNITGSNAGGTAMVSVVIFMTIFTTIGCLAAASRMTWAFARERGLPGYQYLSRVESKTSLPLYAICLSTTISLLLGLINIGSSTAFGALISLLIAGYFSCFTIAAAVMLHKRLTTPANEIPWGRFQLGRAGVPIIILALAYTLLGFFFSFWPNTPNPKPEDMNWSSLVFGSSLLFSMAYWLIWGRKVYTGPVLEVVLDDHAGLFQDFWKQKA